MAAVDDAPQVDVQHTLPFGERQLAHWARADDACVVDQQVHAAQGLLRGVGHGFDLGRFGDVTDMDVRFASRAGDAQRCLLGGGGVDVGDEHAGPPPCELLAERAAQAAACTRDDGSWMGWKAHACRWSDGAQHVPVAAFAAITSAVPWRERPERP